MMNLSNMMNDHVINDLPVNQLVLKTEAQQFLSTHPAPGNRQSTLRQLAPKMMPYYKQKKPHPIYPL